MKKAFLLIVLVLALASAVLAQKSGPDVEVTLKKYEPFPAQPGNYIDVYLVVTNKREVAKDLSVEFIEEYPFTLGSGQQSKKTIGDLQALRENTAVVQYRVNVAPDAINKDYNFTVYHSQGAGNAKVKREFPVTVKTTDASITLETYEFIPPEVAPGETADLKLVFKNTGQGPVKDIDVELDLEGSEISTLGSGTIKRISLINPGQTQEVGFNVIVDGSAPVKVFDIPLELTFRDYLNSKFNQTTRLGMVVKDDPGVFVRLDETEIKKPGEAGTVTLQIINSGIVDVKYVTISLLESDEYEILSYSNDQYLGNLDSDDFEIADFTIKPKVKTPTLKLETLFKDPYNKEYKIQQNLPLRIITEADLGKTSGTWRIVLAVLIIGGVGGYFYYRRRKKAQKHKK